MRRRAPITRESSGGRARAVLTIFRGSDHHGRQGRHQRFRAHRAQRAARAGRVGAHRRAGGRDQRPWPGRDQRPPDPLRQRARPLSRHGDHRRRHHRRGPRPDPRDRDPRPQGAAVGRRGRGAGVHRHLHRPAQGRAAPRERLEARAGLGPLGRRRQDHRVRREPRRADQGRSGGLQRLVHHQLPRPGRLCAQQRHRHRQGIHDDDPQLHRRPADAGHAAQGSLSGPRRRAVDDPDLNRRRQGGGPGAARAERQARRRGDPRADAQRLGGGLQVPAQPQDLGGRDQRRDPRRRRRPAEGRPRLHRPAQRVVGLQPRPALLDLPP